MKKKILFYNGQLFMGGIERVAISYLEGLSKEEDLEITLLIKENDPEKNIFIKDVPKNIPIKFIKTEEMVIKRNKLAKNKKKFLSKLLYPLLLTYERIYMKKWLKKYFVKNKYDVVIDFDMSLGKYLDEIPYPKIGWVHFTLTSKKGRKKERFEKRLKKYEKIVVICDEMKEEIKKLFGIEDKKIVRLYNPFDVDNINNKLHEENHIDKKINLEEEYLVGVSRLAKGKGREDLIEIYYNLKKRGIKEKLYLIGDGAQRLELEDLIKKLELEKDVILLGQQKNPYIYMKNAKLFLHPSYGEGLPTVFLESMICKTPVIAYDCPTGPKDILENGRYGVLVKTGDKKQFEEEIYKLIKDKERRENYINNFYKEKLNEFLMSTILKKFKEVLKEINK